MIPVPDEFLQCSSAHLLGHAIEPGACLALRSVEGLDWSDDVVPRPSGVGWRRRDRRPSGEERRAPAGLDAPVERGGSVDKETL